MPSSCAELFSICPPFLPCRVSFIYIRKILMQKEHARKNEKILIRRRCRRCRLLTVYINVRRTSVACDLHRILTLCVIKRVRSSCRQVPDGRTVTSSVPPIRRRVSSYQQLNEQDRQRSACRRQEEVRREPGRQPRDYQGSYARHRM